MTLEEDEDLILQRASNTLLKKLLTRIPNLLWKKDRHNANQVHRFARQRDVDDILALLKPFKENPQLLDNYLTTFLPSLFNAYIHNLEASLQAPISSNLLPLTSVIGKIGCTFCDIRGCKIISRFFNNEPYLIKQLSERLYQISICQAENDWEERYLLTLWISHLLLAPFDLATVAELHKPPSAPSPSSLTIDLPDGLPNIAGRLVEICLRLIQSPAKEREAAALALSRLCLRPDMRQIYLTETVVVSFTNRLRAGSQSNEDVYLNLGIMLFLERLAAVADNDSWHILTQKTYPVLLEEFEEGHLTPLSSSAAARKLFIKLIRHSAIYYLNSPKGVGPNDKTASIEQTINHLFFYIGDRDSRVRFTAGKAISALVKYLQPPLSAEVVESLLLPLNKEQSEFKMTESYNSVNPLECHGLTMALSFMLYQQSISFSQIGRIIDHLHLTFNFHQLSSAGVPVGSNVRDAACFGLWSLSRRYSNRPWDLPNMKLVSRVTSKSSSVSAVQNAALELLAASCLDPAGNIRRGASAALQELVGRNPDEVEKGISLIQIADYQAVGLIERAVCEVAVQAADLHEIYWNKLLNSLLGWRGIASVDASSRVIAATAIGRICASKSQGLVIQMIDHLMRSFLSCSHKESEQIHGIVLTISSIIRHRLFEPGLEDSMEYRDKVKSISAAELPSFRDLFTRYQPRIYAALKALNPTGTNFEILGVSVCSLLRCMADTQVQASQSQSKTSMKPLIDKIDVFHLLGIYLDCNQAHFLKALADLCQILYAALDPDELEEFAKQCLEKLQQGAYRFGKRASGRLIALGNTLATPKLTSSVQDRVLEELSARCTKEFSIPNRTVAFRSINQAFQHISALDHFGIIGDRLAATILVGLNDYTIDERGDIGLLVRLEALKALQQALRNDITSTSILDDDHLKAAIERLAVEKMDKIRTEAALCLALSGRVSFSQSLDVHATSSRDYFVTVLNLLSSEMIPLRRRALIEGYSSSAGAGSESLVQASRSALISVLRVMPVDDSTHNYTLLGFAEDLLHVLKANYEVDRVVVPVLETLTFLLDSGLFLQLQQTSYRWKTLFYWVQKSHYKSTNVTRLSVAVQAYRGLSDTLSVRSDVIEKLSSMLTHPFPKVRASVAECLYQVTCNEELKRHDWTRPLEHLRFITQLLR